MRPGDPGGPPEGPPAAEAKERLAALDPGARYEVRRAAQGHKTLEDPVLAAAAVACARREKHRMRLLIPFMAALGLGIVILVLLAPDSNFWLALLVGVVCAFAFGIRFWATSAAIARGEASHVEVLRRHGRIPPPGPSGDEETARKGALSLRRVTLVGSLLAVLTLGGSAWVSWQDAELADHLEEVGVRAEATVEDERNHGSLFGLFLGDRAVVEFEAATQSVTTEIVLSDVDVNEGEALEVIYDPSDPEVARPAADPSGRSNAIGIALGIIGSTGAIAGFALWRSYRH